MTKKGLVSKIDGKTNDDFNLRREDRLRLVNTKQKLCILFGIPLALHYLCKRIIPILLQQTTTCHAFVRMPRVKCGSKIII